MMCERYWISNFEKVSINLCILLGGIVRFVSSCMVGCVDGALMHAVIIIVGRIVQPFWVKEIFNVSYIVCCG